MLPKCATYSFEKICLGLGEAQLVVAIEDLFTITVNDGIICRCSVVDLAWFQIGKLGAVNILPPWWKLPG